MDRNAAKGILAAILGPTLGAVIVGVSLWQFSVQSRQFVSIQQLLQLPANSVVHLRGVVIASPDSPGLVWIEDATGALPVPLPQAHLRVGQTVLIEATKTGEPSVPENPASLDARHPGIHTPAKHPRASLALPAPVRNADRPLEHTPQTTDPRIPLSIGNAAPGVQLLHPRIEKDPRWLECAVAGFLLAWLAFVHRRSRLRRTGLRQIGESAHAVRELSTAVQRITRENTFDTEVPVLADPDVAPLAIGFNAMIAEIQRRERARKEAESRLQHWALIDDLTGLPNRRLLSDRLSQSLTKAQRDQKIVALLCIDLDGFKLVNDSFGHSTGDALLSHVAQRLKSRFRQSDTLARIGGDEFAIIIDNLETRADAHKAAETLLELLRTPFEIDNHSIRITASIGISIFPDGNERGQLLQQADCAMYAAKRKGKNCIVLFEDDLGSAARERLTLEAELQHAIANGEISLHYQPEYDLATDTIVRFEALARWEHPRLGLLMPANFIHLAEENGFIISLGACIMERACNDAVTWQQIAGRPIQVAVNVSTLQFARDSFFEDVADILHRTGLHPSLLQIELTESATVAGIDRAAEMMRRLKRMGVSVAVDDFGTGYSCLSYLPKLSFDALKLDRSFVKDIVESRETRSFVESILTLARNLHMRVIVEGVETREQLTLIRSLGAHEAQGYLLGRPNPDPWDLLRRERTGEDPNAGNVLANMQPVA